MPHSDRDDGKRAQALTHLGEVPSDCPDSPEDRGFAECPCPDTCSIQGECRVCTAFHSQQGRLPFCQRGGQRV